MSRKKTRPTATEGQRRRDVYLPWRSGAGGDRVKVNLSLPADLAARLASYAGHLRVEQSAVAARALASELRGFVVYLPSEPAGEGGQEAPRGRRDEPPAIAPLRAVGGAGNAA